MFYCLSYFEKARFYHSIIAQGYIFASFSLFDLWMVTMTIVTKILTESGFKTKNGLL